jgi:hypothetical protein
MTSTTYEYNSKQGRFDLTLLNAESTSASFEEVVLDGIRRVIPPEILTRLKAIWDQTKVIAGKLIAIGKIIVQQIFAFLKANPKIVLGIALGAAVSSLIAGILFFGSLLQPLSTFIATLYGAGVGAAMEGGDYSGSPFTAIIELAHKFFELVQKIFVAISSYLKDEI